MKQPSEAQKAAGNYPKDHRRVRGLRVSVETPAGAERSGTDKNGQPWSVTMQHDYGYIRGTTGKDKDHLDVFLGPAPQEDHPVYVVDQVDPDSGAFDEHKVMLGFPSREAAVQAYHAAYEPGWRGADAVTELPFREFRNWAFDGARKVKPLAATARAQNLAEGGSVAEGAGGAAFGLYPKAGKHRKQDAEAAKDVPYSAARGWLAGTLGLPGDIEWLVRAVGQFGNLPARALQNAVDGKPLQHPFNADLTPVLPTSDFYREWLPGKIDNAANKGGEELGQLFGGAGLGALTRAGTRTAQGVKAAGEGALTAVEGAYRRAEPAIERGVNAVMERGGKPAEILRDMVGAPSYAVKPKGGNWQPTLSAMLGNGSNPKLQARMLGEGADIEAALELLKEPVPTNPVAQWQNKQLRNYFTNQLGTVDDPLLALEREGRLHLDYAALDARRPLDAIHNPDGTLAGPLNARFAGLRAWAEHEALTGRSSKTPWEAVSDAQIDWTPAEVVKSGLSDVLPFLEHGMLTDGSGPTNIPELARKLEELDGPDGLIKEADVLRDVGWLDKVAPDSKVYGFDPQMFNTLGFDHVVDYLRAATTAAEQQRVAAVTGLPGAGPHNELIARNLHLTPEQLARTSVADAVAKTAEWAKLLASAKQLESLNKGVKSVLKAYPESGHQWVELAPEGLRAEGEAMRHCVGGYCSSVADGSTRILSLRGKDGKPAVTVEVEPGKPDELNAYMRFIEDDRKNNGNGFSAWLSDKHAADPMYVSRPPVEAANEYLASVGRELLKPEIKPATIRQIKGPANRAPSEDVLPMVQDLVKNMGPWARVQDLRNAGLSHFSAPERIEYPGYNGVSVPAGYHTYDELRKLFHDAGYSPEDAVDVLNKYDRTLGYSSGGSVGDGSGPGDPAGGGVGPGSDAATDPSGIGAVNGADAASDAAAAVNGNMGVASAGIGLGMPSLGTMGNMASLGQSLGNLSGNQGLANSLGQVGQALGVVSAADQAVQGNVAPAVGIGVAAATGVPAMGNMASSAVSGNTTGVIGAGIDGVLGAMTGGISGVVSGVGQMADPATNPSIGNQIAGIMSGEGNPSNTNPSSANAVNGMDAQSDQGAISQGIAAAEAAAALAANMDNSGSWIPQLSADWELSQTAAMIRKAAEEEALRRYFGLSLGAGLPSLQLS